MIERRRVRFSKFAPTVRDHGVSYSYVNPATGERTLPLGDRWMRAKAHMAEAALWTGAEEFSVYGGAGQRAWNRTVLVSQEDAEAYLRDEIEAGNFMLKGRLRRALVKRDARLRRETKVS
jgi:hypothetical protein